MKKNKLILTLGVLSILSFELAAKLIPITVGANDTYTLATFITDVTTGEKSAVQYNSNQQKVPIAFPNSIYYHFDTTGYKGGDQYLSISESGKAVSSISNEKKVWTITTDVILKTTDAPNGTFKILSGKNVEFIVTVVKKIKKKK